MARCAHNWKVAGPGQSTCTKCGLLRNHGTPRARIFHRHVWHMDKRARQVVCKTCGAAK
jgi:hypothetical protein